jgi:hypothetical protein
MSGADVKTRSPGATRRGWNGALALLLTVAFLSCGFTLAQSPEWIDVDYGALVDRRELSHSGETVGALLDRLDGRPLPPRGERPSDHVAHALLDPLLEPYAFVLQDVLDRLLGAPDPPMIEVGSLWTPGQRQPAWVELLRARRFLVEGDGTGRLRLCLPADDLDGDPSTLASAEAARHAYDRAWPVLRHVFAAERRRLGGDGNDPIGLRVAVHPYSHARERSSFRLGLVPLEVEVMDTRPDGLRPPLDLAAFAAFLAAGLQPEGGRLDDSGELRLLGSRDTTSSALLGRPLELGDLAVAYRTVFHGGLSEPFMSLDRGFSPQTSIVNYGGRLRDTDLGRVSLLCDIRFKTFSLGIDIVTGRDVREDVRQRLPGFLTHLERFSSDPSSAGVHAQQTRLWFYPDRVDLTVAPQGDVLAMRRVRMSAASERIQGSTMTAGAGEDPPWTRATVSMINESYDALTTFFPELSDLDHVVRLAASARPRRAPRAGTSRDTHSEALPAAADLRRTASCGRRRTRRYVRSGSGRGCAGSAGTSRRSSATREPAPRKGPGRPRSTARAGGGITRGAGSAGPGESRRRFT